MEQGQAADGLDHLFNISIKFSICHRIELSLEERCPDKHMGYRPVLQFTKSKYTQSPVFSARDCTKRPRLGKAGKPTRCRPGL